MIGQLVLGLSLLVGLHEFGHFAFAKLFKIRVTKFYIFFDFLFPTPRLELQPAEEKGGRYRIRHRLVSAGRLRGYPRHGGRNARSAERPGRARRSPTSFGPSQPGSAYW
ncbi:MAG: site-2 protease family protein [Hymenobacter sp.]